MKTLNAGHWYLIKDTKLSQGGGDRIRPTLGVFVYPEVVSALENISFF